MSKIRKSAINEECSLRLPGVCKFDRETTVLAHIQTYGFGTKCNDIHAVYACNLCHDVIDGRLQNHGISDVDLKEYILDALIETQVKLIEKGLIIIK